MKKTGLLSFQNANNYGALLQMFALQTALEKQGISVEVINYDSSNMGLKAEQFPIFSNFKDKYLKLSREYVDKSQIDIEAYDVVIVGSDQVWNVNLTKGDTSYFLDFVNETVKKVSYAASIGGGEELENKVEEYLKEYVPLFSNVSLREKGQVGLVQKYFDKEVVPCVDPSLLLTKEDYIKELGLTGSRDKDYILLFNLKQDERLRDFANILALYSNKKLVVISHFETEYSFVDKTRFLDMVEPREWLNYIKDASLVLTDSFHAVMFSFIFRKPFYVFVQYDERAIRLTDFLKEFHLEDRLLSDMIKPSKINFEIDYKVAEEVLEERRNSSFNFLENIYK